MSNYTTDNMGRFLGSDSNNADAERLAAYLIGNGWTLEIPDGENEYHASIEENGEWREMDDQEWQAALAACFN